MERLVKVVLGLALAGAAIVFVGRLLVGITGQASLVLTFSPEHPRGGCPSTENCVSSYAAADTSAAIDPLACNADPITAEQVFAEAIRTLPDVESTSGTSWIVYSRTFRFPDDVRIEVSQRGIEVLSASRLGAGDLGVNRRRVETLRPLVEDDPRCL